MKALNFRKITGVSLLIILLSVLMLFIGTNGAAFAVTVDSDVYADLMQMTIDGKKFDVADYPADANGETRMLSFIEYGYAFDAPARDKFALFVYVYNPKKDVVATSGQNKIQLASAYDKSGNASEYAKYRLQLVSASADGLFLKYKIAESAEIVKRLTNRDARRYDVTHIDMHEKGKVNATAIAVQKHFVFSGYMKGFGENPNADGNLTCTLPGKVESINFDLKHTYYRTGVSDAGADHYNQINTVYFSIPKKYLQEFDRIYSITPEFWEYKTKYAMVTSDNDFKNNFLPYTKNDYSNMSDYPEYFLANKNLHTVANTATNGVDYYPDWSFAMKFAKSGTKESMIPYAFYSPAVDVDTIFRFLFSKPVAGKVGSKELSDWIYSYSNNLGHGYIDCNGRKISKDLFENYIDANRAADGWNVGYNKRPIYFDDTFECKSYDSNHKWYQKLFDYGYHAIVTKTSDGEKTVNPMVILDDSYNYVFNKSNEEISDELLVSKDDVADLKTFRQKAKTNEEVVVLFRFAVTDYESKEVTRGRTWLENVWVPVPKTVRKVSTSTGDTYISRQTIFLDFTIIQVNFQKDETIAAIPTIASPIDIINPIDDPSIAEKPLMSPDALKQLIIFIVAIVLTVIFTILLFILLEKLIVKQFNNVWAKIGMGALCLIVAFAVSAACMFLCASAVYGAIYKVDFNAAAKAFWKYVISRK
ncbi:MAG: hypothetical protein ACI4VW_07600 [Acutalibacteraceae bacterium]